MVLRDQDLVTCLLDTTQGHRQRRRPETTTLSSGRGLGGEMVLETTAERRVSRWLEQRTRQQRRPSAMRRSTRSVRTRQWHGGALLELGFRSGFRFQSRGRVRCLGTRQDMGIRAGMYGNVPCVVDNRTWLWIMWTVMGVSVSGDTNMIGALEICRVGHSYVIVIARV